MISRAILCFSSVVPAQQDASTVIFVLGKTDLITSALEITHISVQTPTSSISVKSTS